MELLERRTQTECYCLETMKLLVSLGGDADAVNSFGVTPLCIAAYYGNPNMVEFLIGKFASINHQTKSGSTPLYLSAKNGHIETTRILLEHGASTKEVQKSAAIAGHTTVLMTLVKLVGLEDRIGRSSWTLLHWAAQYGRLETCQWLVESAGVELDSKNCLGRTPLHHAIDRGHHSVAEFLVSKGADVNCRDYDFRTPLYFAEVRGNVTLVNFLKSHGGNRR